MVADDAVWSMALMSHVKGTTTMVTLDNDTEIQVMSTPQSIS